MRRSRPRLGMVLLIGSIAIVIATALSLLVGDAPLSPSELWGAFVNESATSASIVVTTIRVPRALLAITTGAALGVAGALTQSLTRNPIADPGVLGVTAGAGLSVVLAGVLLGFTSPVTTIWFALAGALLTTLAVYTIAAGRPAAADPSRLLLAGVAISALFGGVMTTMTQLNPDVFAQMASWGAGSLSRRGWEPLLVALPFIGAGIVVAVVVTPALNQLSLGDRLSQATGAPVARTRSATIIAIAFLAGGATAMVGPIAFVGLMVPHIARRFSGPDQTRLVVYSALIGPTLLLVADVIGRVALPVGELPVGIVTGLIGAPVLVVLLGRMRAPRS
ncbi:MAG: FecCD family ABC transporter permease [Microbacterium sp.]